MKTISTNFLVPLFLVFCFAALPLQANTVVVPEPEQVNEAIRGYVDDSRMAPGVVVGLVHNGQRSIYSYGDSGRDAVPLDEDTLFEIGSITKVFTGLLLAEMARSGEVGYSDTVADLAPDDYSFGERVGRIILQQLATRTSGLPRLAMDPGAADARAVHFGSVRGLHARGDLSIGFVSD